MKKAYPDVEIVWYNTKQENSLEELLTEYYDSSEESSLVEQDITGKVVEDNTNESSKSLVEDTIPVMGGLELSSNHDSIE
ncbi:MAG: hypothetical protein LN568_03700 [Rickettsia endosymbiont of Pseudomimeciton antennatum]|nr:hypothetical protein [Rickettsia endosymbiont of Pseudomimeciton antennatum]